MFSPQVLKIILFFPFGLFLSLKGERACAAPIVVETRMENFEALRAGQKVVGLKEVEIRVRNFLSQFDIDFEQYRLLSKEDPRVSEVLTSDELKAWMEKKPIKVMATPSGNLHIIDGHHMAMSLHLLGQDKVKAIVYQEEIAQGLSDDEIWQIFKESGWVYLKDRNRNKLAPEELPKFIGDLEDDPFRSLAWMLKKMKVFDKLDISFQEFYWADFLHEEFSKNGIQLDFSSNESYREALESSVELIISQGARLDFPGSRPLSAKALRSKCAKLMRKFL